MSKVTIMVGLPNSGKSTVAAKISKDTNARVFSGDYYLELIAKRETGDDSLSYNDCFKYCQEKKINWWAECLQDARVAMKNYDCDIVIDGTHMSVKSRRKVCNSLGIKEAHLVLVIRGFGPMMNQDRPGKTIGGHVYRNMVNGFCMPTPRESIHKGIGYNVETVLI